MGVSEMHTIGAVVIDDTVDKILGGIGQLSIPLQTEVRSDPKSGELYSRFASIVARNAQAQFRTRMLEILLTNVPVTGLSIDALATGLDIYATKLADGGSRATGANQSKYSIIRGIMAIRRLTCQYQGDAEADVIIHAMQEGATEPVVKTDSVSLPTMPTEEVFTLGKIVLDGPITIDHVKSIDIDFGLTIRTEGADGDINPSFAYIERIQPKIMLRGVKLAHFGASFIPITGKALTHAATAIYLRKRLAGGTFELDASAEHIKMTVAGIAVIATALDGGQSGAPAEVEIEITPTFDGTNAPIAVTLNQAIP